MSSINEGFYTSVVFYWHCSLIVPCFKFFINLIAITFYLLKRLFKRLCHIIHRLQLLSCKYICTVYFWLKFLKPTWVTHQILNFFYTRCKPSPVCFLLSILFTHSKLNGEKINCSQLFYLLIWCSQRYQSYFLRKFCDILISKHGNMPNNLMHNIRLRRIERSCMMSQVLCAQKHLKSKSIKKLPLTDNSMNRFDPPTWLLSKIIWKLRQLWDFVLNVKMLIQSLELVLESLTEMFFVQRS